MKRYILIFCRLNHKRLMQNNTSSGDQNAGHVRTQNGTDLVAGLGYVSAY